jgi:D-lactate dehydrogenase
LTADDLEKYDRLTILDPIEYLYSRLLPKLRIRQLNHSAALHPNCSAVKLGLAGKLEEIAKKCASEVFIPWNLKCCGYAGDRGLLFPELTRSASKPEAEEVLAKPRDGYYSSNITCEMGMSQATGKPYRSIFYLVEKATREDTPV